MARVFRLFARLFTRMPRPFLYTFAGVGACYSIPALIHPFYQYYRVAYDKPLDLQSRYGARSWVVVSGGTDGIGEVFAHEFAKLGFNVAIIGRNAGKLTKVTKDLEKYGVETKAVLFDLAETLPRWKELVGKLGKHFEGVDVAVVVNNAGVMKTGEFEDEEYQHLVDTINVNCGAHTVVSRFFVPRMMKREHRGAVINVSSVLGKFPLGYSSVYSASKAYHRALSLTLNEEVRSKLDVLSLLPGKTNTKLVGYPGERMDTASPQEVVRTALISLGRTTETSGAFNHYLMAFGGDYVNERLARMASTYVFKRFFVKHREEELEKKIEKK